MSKKNELKEPKTSAPKAPIDLDDIVNEKIYTLIQKLQKEPDFDETWYIFGDKNPISAHALDNAKDRYFKKAGINKHLRIHDFRHSCATWLHSKGLPITVISKILRHKNIGETQKNLYSFI